MTAVLPGKAPKHCICRIDRSPVVSKHIGETEMNMSKGPQRGAGRNWILFLDEGDAPLGLGTRTTDAPGRSANREVCHLLQRLKDRPGVVVLASNRRPQPIVSFPLPRQVDRLRWWRSAFPGKTRLHDAFDLNDIADTFESPVDSIVRAFRYPC